MPESPREFGVRSEALAARHLEENGYVILERNYRVPEGEIDIIARDGGAIVFVEVKARRSGRFGAPGHAVTPSKQRKISLAALRYLKAAGHRGAARFDVASVRSEKGRVHVEIIRNAFGLSCL